MRCTVSVSGNAGASAGVFATPADATTPGGNGAMADQAGAFVLRLPCPDTVGVTYTWDVHAFVPGYGELPT